MATSQFLANSHTRTTHVTRFSRSQIPCPAIWHPHGTSLSCNYYFICSPFSFWPQTHTHTLSCTLHLASRLTSKAHFTWIKRYKAGGLCTKNGKLLSKHCMVSTLNALLVQPCIDVQFQMAHWFLFDQWSAACETSRRDHCSVNERVR